MSTVSRLACVSLLAIFLSACAGEAGPAPSVSVGDLSQQLQTGNAPLVVDVRSAEEFATGHIPGALNIPFQEIGEHSAHLASSSSGVALYCMVGPRARKAEAALVAAGYGRDIHHIDGGLTAWKEAGLPVEADR